MAANLARRRLRRKQPAPEAFRLARERAHAPAALQALADEGWSELTSLSEDAKRKHVHWTHVRTRNPLRQQPASFSRQGFWEFLCKVYKEVYPAAENKTGSILLFGMVAKERHAAAQQELLRDEHHHTPVYTARQHYWRPVAQRALEVYNVKLHAACHDGRAMTKSNTYPHLMKSRTCDMIRYGARFRGVRVGFEFPGTQVCSHTCGRRAPESHLQS